MTLADGDFSVSFQMDAIRDGANLLIVSPQVYRSLARFAVRFRIMLDDFGPAAIAEARAWWRRKDMRRARMARKKRRGWA